VGNAPSAHRGTSRGKRCAFPTARPFAYKLHSANLFLKIYFPTYKGRKRRPWRIRVSGLIGLFLKQLLRAHPDRQNKGTEEHSLKQWKAFQRYDA
jgi:hypothetical protein